MDCLCVPFAIFCFVAMPTSAMASVSCIACNPILPAHSPSLWRRYHRTPLLQSMPTRISCRNAVGKPQCCLPSSSSPSSSSLECSSDSASSSSRAASRRDMLILAGGGAAAAAFPSSAQEVFTLFTFSSCPRPHLLHKKLKMR